MTISNLYITDNNVRFLWRMIRTFRTSLVPRRAASGTSTELETKASSHEGQCIPAGYCHTNAHYVGGVNNCLNSNHTKYFAQLCGRVFAFLKISAANLRTLWRHLPMELRNFLCVAQHIRSSNKRRKQRPNRCIIGDAILPETGTKLTKKRGL